MNGQNNLYNNISSSSNSGNKFSMNKFNNNSKEGGKTLLYISLGLLVAGVIGFLVWFIVLRKDLRGVESPFSQGGKVDVKNVANFLTGELYAEGQTDWTANRPLAVMMNNYIDARPQSGLINADLVYEVVAEGGITRFLAFFLSQTPEKIGPVRSTREYYLVLVKEIGDAMLMHIGYSPQALEAIETWPVRSLARGGAEFWREDRGENIATEHTAYVSGVALRELGVKLGWEGIREFRSWSFKEDREGYDTSPTTDSLTVDFWSKGDYSAIFKYDSNENVYLRYTGYDENDNPVSHTDLESGNQIKVKNIIVQFVTEAAIFGDEKNRLDYELVGSGEGLVFLDGKVINVTWSKEDRDARTIFYDTDGSEMRFNRGKIWVCIVPDRNVDQVTY